MHISKNRKLNIIPNYIYFYHLDEFFILPFHPDNVTDSLNSTFASTNALSRSAPVFTYSNSGPRTVTINFTLHRDLLNDLNKKFSNVKLNVVSKVMDEDYVDKLIGYLQAVALPKYELYNNGSKSVKPPEIAIRLGNEVFVKGVVNSGIQINYRKPINEYNRYSQIDVSFTVSETDPYDAVTVAKEGSFRGLIAGGINDIYKG